MPREPGASRRCGSTGNDQVVPPSWLSETWIARSWAVPSTWMSQYAARAPSAIGTTPQTSIASQEIRRSEATVHAGPQPPEERSAYRSAGAPSGPGSIQLTTTRSPNAEISGAELLGPAGIARGAPRASEDPARPGAIFSGAPQAPRRSRKTGAAAVAARRVPAIIVPQRNRRRILHAMGAGANQLPYGSITNVVWFGIVSSVSPL